MKDHHDQAQGSGDDEYDDWLQPIDPPCHRCGSNRAHMGYGLGCGPMGTYTVCECGCVLAHSPDMEGLTDEECARRRRRCWPITGSMGGSVGCSLGASADAAVTSAGRYATRSTG